MPEGNVYLSIPFPTSESAKLVYDVLNIDKEHKRSEVRRELSTEDVNLKVRFHGTDLKRLRVALNNTLKNVLLISKTTDMFKN